MQGSNPASMVAPRSVPLFGAQLHTTLKIIEMGMALALGGRQSMNMLNNQLIVEGSSWIDIGKKARGGRSV
jgi:hypothetical protein